MANVPNGEPAINLQEVTSGLERELRLRGSQSVTLDSTPLTQALATCLSANRNKTSPRTNNSASSARGFFHSHRADTGSHILSPTNSVSSDSSLSGYATGCFPASSRETERDTVAPASSVRGLSVGPSTRSIYPIGNIASPSASDSQSGLAVQVGGSRGPLPSMTVGCAKPALAASASVGNATAKVTKPKRQRKSKKPKTQTLDVPQAEFRAKVQELTGYPPYAAPQVSSGPHLPALRISQSPAVAYMARPQPKRHSTIGPIDVDVNVIDCGQSSSARLEAPSTSMMSTVRCLSPVSDQTSGGKYVYRDSGSSSSTSAALNYCMGYEPPLQNLSKMLGLSTDNLHSASDSPYDYNATELQVSYTSCELPANSAGPPGSGFQLAAPMISESNRTEDTSREYRSLGGRASPRYRAPLSDNISRERTSLGGHHGSNYSPVTLDHVSNPSIGDVPFSAGHGGQGIFNEDFEMNEDDVEANARTLMIDSWFRQ